MDRIQTYGEFWPYYLREHSKPTTRLLHLIGTSMSLVIGFPGIFYGQPLWLLAALVQGYAFAWVGHFFVEGNKPATFKYPLWSFISDWKMWGFALAGKLPAELERAGIQKG